MGLIDFLSRRGGRAALLAGAAAVLLGTPAPSFAQKTDPLEEEAARGRTRMRALRDLERMIDAAEAARLRGQCKTVAQIHSYFHGNFEGMPDGVMEYIGRLRERIDAIAAADCPPGSGTPSVQPPVAQPTPEPLEGHDDILDEIGDDIGTTTTGLPPRPEPPAPPAVDPPPEPRRTPPPVPARQPEEIHVRPEPTPDAEPRRTPPPRPPRKPEEIHVPPKPVAAPTVYEPSNPTPDSPYGQNLDLGADTVMTEEREADEQGALAALEALSLKGDCAAYLAERERLRGLLTVLKLPPEAPCPPVTAAPQPVTRATTPAAPKATSLRDQALTANLRHAQASDPCDAAAMARHLQELDRLVNEAEMEMHSWDGPMYRETWMRKAEDYQEIQKIRDAARKRQADCPKDRRVGLNPQDQQFLALHNQARSEVGAKPLEWDPALAAGAKAYAIQLTSAGQLVHSSREDRKDIRENLLQSRPGQSLQAMIGVWTAEKRYFKPGIFPDVSTTGDWVDTGHWTQMTWATTTRVGCATHGDTRFTWLVCRYSPPGNRDGTAVGQENPRPPVLANQDGIAPANSTNTTAPPPPPPPTARDPAPDGDETRHPLVTMANGAFDAFTAAWRDGDRAAQERELIKLRYALDELRKRLKAARKAGPFSAVDPAKVEKQVKDLERQLKTAEDRFNGREERG